MKRVVLIWAGIILSQSVLAGVLAAPSSWGYQLDHIDPAVIAASPYELMVIDYSRDGSAAGAFTAAEVSSMKRKPDGGKRTLLAYMSIGEAEDYRFYWRTDWKHEPPPWLAKENPDWPGNYKVHYWDPGWQRIIFGNPEAYLDRIIDAGFDGVYLDIIDAFEYFQARYPEAAQRMSMLVSALADYARRRRPGFLVFAQNGETLVGDQRFLGAIDGIAKEDLYYGMEEQGRANATDEITYSLKYLVQARDAGKTILIVTYAEDPARVEAVAAKARQHGFIPYAGVRKLDRLTGARVVTPTEPGPARAAETQTPGSFFALTTPRGTIKTQLFLGHFREQSLYQERDRLGVPTYREQNEYRQWDSGVQVKYGLTEHLDVGIHVPLTHATEVSVVTLGDAGRARRSSTGLGNPVLLADLGGSLGRGATHALLEMELGLPTSDDDEVFSSGSTFRLAANLEHYWDHIGVLGIIARDWSAAEDFEDWESQFSYQVGLGAELGPRLYGSVLLGEYDHIANAEASLEYLLGSRLSVELNLTADLEGDREAWEALVGVNLWLQ